MTKFYSMFLEEAMEFFASNPNETIFTNTDAYYIAIRHPKIDSMVIYEWHEMIENYSARIYLHTKEKDEKGIIK